MENPLKLIVNFAIIWDKYAAIIFNDICSLFGTISAQPRWEPRMPGTFKLNVDGSFACTGATGWRYTSISWGLISSWFCSGIPYSCTLADEVENIAIKEGIRSAKHYKKTRRQPPIFWMARKLQRHTVGKQKCTDVLTSLHKFAAILRHIRDDIFCDGSTRAEEKPLQTPCNLQRVLRQNLIFLNK
jgi:hypothetical protein